MATKFKYNPAATALLARTVAMVETLGAKADEGAEACRSIAPVLTGDYRDGIVGESGLVKGMAAGRVNAHDFKSHWIEFGTTDTPTFAVLRRGLESIGLRVSGGRAS